MRHTVFPLHPETPAEGMKLAELFAGRGYDLDAMFARLQQVAAEVGLPVGRRTHTYNSRLAQELGKWAEEQGHGDRFRDAAYRSYFADGRNIHDREVLLAIAAAAGLPTDTAGQVLASRSHEAAVDADWRRAGDLGITAVPTLRYRGRTLVGFTSYERMRQLISG